MTAQRDAVMRVLSEIVDPCSIATGFPINLIDMGMVEQVECVDGTARVTLLLTSPICWQAANIVSMIEDKALSIDGISKVDCSFSQNDWMPDMMSDHAIIGLRAIRPMHRAKREVNSSHG